MVCSGLGGGGEGQEYQVTGAIKEIQMSDKLEGILVELTNDLAALVKVLRQLREANKALVKEKGTRERYAERKAYQSRCEGWDS